MVARLVLGVVWLVAGLRKVGDLATSLEAIRAYELLSFEAVQNIGKLLPWLEIVIGVLLLLGLLTRTCGVVSGILLVLFLAGVVSVWIRDIEIDPGFFSDGGPLPNANAKAKYPWEILRDVILLGFSLLLIWRPRTPWAIDNKLFP